MLCVERHPESFEKHFLLWGLRKMEMISKGRDLWLGEESTIHWNFEDSNSERHPCGVWFIVLGLVLCLVLEEGERRPLNQGPITESLPGVWARGFLVYSQLKNGASKITVYTFLLEMGSFFRGYVSDFLGVEGLLAELSRHFNQSAGNVLNCQIPGHCQTVVGNIPYRISSALISKLLRQEPPLQRIAARHGAWAAGARIVL